MINKHGILVCVDKDEVERNIARGSRLVTDEDMAFIESSPETFCIPYITGMERSFTDVPASVIGCGPSWEDGRPFAMRVGVNSRVWQDIAFSHVVSLDDIYFDSKAWTIHRLGSTALWPLNCNGPKNHNDGHPFAMPIHPVANAKHGNKDAEIVLGGAVTRAQYSAIIATLCALYLTTGAVVIAGVDLSGVDEAGVPYARMADAWEAASKVFPKRVYVSENMSGPLTEFLPRYVPAKSGV